MTKTDLPSLYKFWKMLRNHDWTFQYSDDHSVWRRGTAEFSAIKEVVDLGGKEYETLFEEYSKYAWRKDDTIKEPARPIRTKEEQIHDMEMFSYLSSSLELMRDEIFSIETEQITSATEIWKLLNPIQSMLHHLSHIVNDKCKSTSSDTKAFKEYKRLNESLSKLF